MVKIFGVPNIEYVGYGVGGIIILYILFRIFKSFRGETRITEEEQELGIERKEENLTEKELSMERKEQKTIRNIIKILGDIYKNLTEKIFSSPVIVGNQSINVHEAVKVLIDYLEKLIQSNITIRKEEAILGNIRNYWAIVKQGLTNNLQGLGENAYSEKEKARALEIIQLIQSEYIAKIDSLFKDLGVTLKMEEEISEQKLRLVNEQYQLIRKEEGSKAA